jgi:Family of unknown function (DUF6428)
MNTQEFLSTLESLPNQALVFDYGNGQVKPGYHVTEVMNVTYETMDCGGQANFWRETVVQLMEPGDRDKSEYMTVEKFLKIYKKVVTSVPVRPDSDMRFEYGDTNLPAIHYHVGDIQQYEGAVTVYLTKPGVTCKASDKGTCNTSASQSSARCCTPAKATTSNMALVGSEAQQGSGCC